MKANQYLIAASEVLARAGRSMHYESITAVALKFGLLKTTSKTPYASMRNQINRDIWENPRSIFSQISSGVYKSKGILVPSWVLNLTDKLQEKLCMADNVAVLRRALDLYKRAIELSDEQKNVRMIGDIQEIELQELSIYELVECADELDGNNFSYWFLILDCKCFEGIELSPNLINLAVKLQRRSNEITISEVFQLSLLLIEIAFRLILNSKIIQLCSSTEYIKVPIFIK
jgi:hypothetical protein